MITICEANEIYSKILNRKKKPVAEELRLHRFCESVQTEAGLLVLHLCTEEMLVLQDTDFSGGDRTLVPGALRDETAAYLKEHMFFVPEHHNDAADVDAIRSVIRAVERSHFDGYTHFTVLPTTDCNARCYYCYEHDTEKISMDAETARSTARFILENRSRRTEAIRLSWFGGEPLYNNTAIDLICGELQAAGVEYHSGIVSNGLLFDGALIEKAVGLWKADVVQITLDGTEKVYNRVKAYIGGPENAYRRVMNNIAELLTAGVEITIRLNVSESNIDDLRSLAFKLASLEGPGKLSVYSNLLFQYQGEEMSGRRTALLHRKKELDALLASAGLLSTQRDEKNLRIFACMADDPKSVIIMPDGGLCSCEHFPVSMTWGRIHDGKTKMSARIPDPAGEGVISPAQYWSEEYPREESCTDCRVYPFCVRLKHCFVEDGHCMRDEADAVYEAVRREMLRRFRERK